MRATSSWLWLWALALAACGDRRVGGAVATVTFTRSESLGACIRVAATDALTIDSGTLLSATTDVSLSDFGTSGAIAVDIARGADWSNQMQISAALHLGSCGSQIALANDAKRVTLQDNEVLAVALTLTEIGPPPDGGPADAGRLDGGSFDAGGLDAGPADAGSFDASMPFDAGPFDAGTPDASMAFDAGTFDAGTFDAGPSCSGTFFALPSPMTTLTFNDVAMFETNIALLAGDNGSLYAMISDGGYQPWTDADCGGDLKAIWAKQSNQVMVASTNSQLSRYSGPGSCTPNVAMLAAGTPTAMASYSLGTTSRLWVSGMNPPGMTRIELDSLGASVGTPTTYSANSGLPSNDSQVFDVGGTSDDNVFAVGFANNQGFFLQFNPNKNRWETFDTKEPNLRRVRAVAFASPNAGFAGGQDFYTYNGSKWSKQTSPSFEIFAFKVFSATNVIAVGSETAGSYGLAKWDGATWTAIAGPGHSGGANAWRVDGTSVCDTWAVGPNQAIITSNAR